MQLAVLLQSFDREYLAAVGLHGKHGARLDGATIDYDRARAAVAGVATDVRSREPKHSRMKWTSSSRGSISAWALDPVTLTLILAIA